MVLAPVPFNRIAARVRLGRLAMARNVVGAIISGIGTALVAYVLGLILVQVNIDLLASIGGFLRDWAVVLGVIAFVAALLGLRGR